MSENSENRTESSTSANKQSNDIEKGPEPETSNTEAAINSNREEEKKEIDPYLVDWAQPDPEDPHNWPIKKKWLVTMLVSCVTFISPCASSIIAPAASTIAKDLHINTLIETQMIISIFILGYAIGPLFLSPLSEVYGRRPVLQLANLFFCIFNLVCGFSTNKVELIIFRFLSGLGGSAPLSVGGGLIGDIWNPTERGKSMAIYSLMPVLGPSLGPIAGGYIAEYSSWKWAFRATSIADVFVLVAAFFFMPETYGPRLLSFRASKIRLETGDERYHTKYETKDRTLAKLLATNIVRPFKLLSTEIIIQVLGLYMAYLYGLLYILLTTFPQMWTEQYHESIAAGGLNYISISLGYAAGAQFASYFIDKLYKRLIARNNGVARPEFRIPLIGISSIIMPIGLFWYGWSAQAKLNWIMPNIGMVITCWSLLISYTCIQTYIIDSYRLYAASAIAAVAVTRSLCGAFFPLWAPYMYDALHYGWGNTVLGCIAIVIGCPAPFVLWKWGPALRARSAYAAASN